MTTKPPHPDAVRMLQDVLLTISTDSSCHRTRTQSCRALRKFEELKHRGWPIVFCHEVLRPWTLDIKNLCFPQHKHITPANIYKLNVAIQQLDASYQNMQSA